MEFLYLLSYACLRLRFLDVETNHGLQRPVHAICRLLFSNLRCMAGKLCGLTLTSSRYDILLCSETLVSVAGLRISALCLVVQGQDASGPMDGGICTRWI